MELLKTIALLCNLHTGANESYNIEIVRKIELECQKTYIKCLGNEINANYKTLSKCILERK